VKPPRDEVITNGQPTEGGPRADQLYGDAAEPEE